jgi:hypothetical protein
MPATPWRSARAMAPMVISMMADAAGARADFHLTRRDAA